MSILEGKHEYIFEEFAKDFTANSGNAFMNAHYVADYCNSTTRDFFINVIWENCIDKSQKDYFIKIVNIWEKYISNIDYQFNKSISELPNNDVSIKDFPKNADTHDKEILDKLAKAFLINRELSSNGMYDMAHKRMGKAIARFLLKNGLNETWGIVFMNKYINHNVERATVVNYFNECPKDMPIKK